MSEWIDASLRKPEAAPVLICFLEPSFGGMTQEIGVGYYDDPDDYSDPKSGQGWLFWIDDKKVLGGGVTHWMEMPKLPTTAQEADTK